MILHEYFHRGISLAIDKHGVYPHHCLVIEKDDKLTFCCLDLKPEQVWLYVRKLITEGAKELIFGMDRFAKPDQGTTLGDFVAGARFDGKFWTSFVIEYQHEPRIVKDIDWHNSFWNGLMTNEILSQMSGAIVKVVDA